MKTTISKTFDFAAAHFLPNVADGHKCRRMHGHNYRVEIVCSGPIDLRGMVVDYSEIADSWAGLHTLLDHGTLNELIGLENPTAESLAYWIFCRLGLLAHLESVRVSETPNTWAEVRR